MDDATIDAVGKQIVEGGYVSNWKLFRRWVMSQMFHMLRTMDGWNWSFNQVLQRKGYEYQWRMLENELYAQMNMCDHKDYENTKARYRWFNGCVAYDMAIDYINKLRSYIDDKCIYTTKNQINLSFMARARLRNHFHSLPYISLNASFIILYF